MRKLHFDRLAIIFIVTLGVPIVSYFIGYWLRQIDPTYGIFLSTYLGFVIFALGIIVLALIFAFVPDWIGKLINWIMPKEDN